MPFDYTQEEIDRATKEVIEFAQPSDKLTAELKIGQFLAALKFNRALSELDAMIGIPAKRKAVMA